MAAVLMRSLDRLNCSLMRFSISPRAQYNRSYNSCAGQASGDNELTTKRGFSFPPRCSALATTRRGRLQLSPPLVLTGGPENFPRPAYYLRCAARTATPPKPCATPRARAASAATAPAAEPSRCSKSRPANGRAPRLTACGRAPRATVRPGAQPAAAPARSTMKPGKTACCGPTTSHSPPRHHPHSRRKRPRLRQRALHDLGLFLLVPVRRPR